MNVEQKVGRTSTDAVKFGASAVLTALGVMDFYYLADSGRLLRLLALLAPLGAAVAIALLTGPGQELISFARDTQIEVKKVVWPSRQETIQTTGVIIAIVVVAALFLWILDMLLGGFTRWLLGQGG
ncbi:MAG: preprotein translocase subunit SecE [Gammaproteobacteria bacterium]|nr:preprotein translocase subunit SecE [Gammaproteobacteria bacterium]